MNQLKPLEITKLEAAQYQLEAAAELFLQRSNPVPIHTLACAAYEVVSGLNSWNEGVPMLKSGLGRLPPDKQKQLRDFLNDPQNFLKHADRDPEGTIVLEPELTLYFLMEAIDAFGQLAGNITPIMEAFYIWMLTFFDGEPRDGGQGFSMAYPPTEQQCERIRAVARRYQEKDGANYLRDSLSNGT